MKKLSPEQISACVDGEASADELHWLTIDDEARCYWQRFHLIRDSLQNELPVLGDFSLADKVAAAIANEPTVLAPRARARWREYVPAVMSLAVAASVFVVIVGSWQYFQRSSSGETAMAGSTTVMSSATLSVPAAAPTTDLADEDQRRLEELLINHTEAVSANGLQVMLPYARVVSDRIAIPVEEPVLDEKNGDAKNAGKKVKKELPETKNTPVVP